jgi:hypothetical protein
VRVPVDAEREDRSWGYEEEVGMDRIRSTYVALWSALALWAAPTLALAQGQGAGRAPSPSGAAPAGGAPGEGGGAGWLWIVAALAVIAIIWWAMSSRERQRGTTAR